MRNLIATVLGLVLGIGCMTAPAQADDPTAQRRHNLVVSADPAAVTPQILNGTVLAIATTKNTVVLGGNFTRVRNPGGGKVLKRTGLLAFHRASGRVVRGFAPRLAGRVNSLSVGAGGTVYAGGEFDKVNGRPAVNLARLRLADGRLVASFRPKAPDLPVRDVHVVGGRLFIAGDFSRMGRRARSGLAELRASTGALSRRLRLTMKNAPYPERPFVTKLAVSPGGGRIVAIGRFTSVDGFKRVEAVMLNVSGTRARVMPWRTRSFEPTCRPGFQSMTRDVGFSPDGSYFVITTTGAYRRGPPKLCDTVSRWETGARGDDVRPSWVAYTGGDSVYAVAVTGSAVYVGGHHRWFNNPFRGNEAGPGAVPREGVAALDPDNGLPLAWDPGRSRGVGVRDLVASRDGLYMGSDTEKVAGERHARIAFFPLRGGTAVVAARPAKLPAQVFSIGRAGGSDDRILRRDFDGRRAGTAVRLQSSVSWTSARASFLARGNLYSAWSNGSLVRRSWSNAAVGPRRSVNLRGLSSFRRALRDATSLFYDHGRIYYSRAGSAKLYMRYFSFAPDIVGAQEFVVDKRRGGIPWGRVDSAFRAGSSLYWVDASGALHRSRWKGSRPGRGMTISGPGIDGIDWRARSTVVENLRANKRPTASFQRRCVALTCEFDAAASTDADGQILRYRWNFGDGTQARGGAAQRRKVYQADGTYTVTLTVTDDRGGRRQVTRTITVSDRASPISFVSAATSAGQDNRVTYDVRVPDEVEPGDLMVLAFATNAPRYSITGPQGWSTLHDVRSGAMRTRLMSRIAAPGDAGSDVAVSLSARAKGHLALLAYRGVDTGDPVVTSATRVASGLGREHVTPRLDVAVPASWLVSLWTNKSAGTSRWRGPSGQVERVDYVGDGAGHVGLLAMDAGRAVPIGTAGGLTARSDAQVRHAIMATIVVRPAG